MTVVGEYAVFAVVFAASAAAPGPEIAAIVGCALSRGWRGCVPLALGIIVGKVALLAVAIAGATALVTALGPWFTVGLYLGAAYLCFLGVRTWRNATAATVEVDRRAERHGGRWVVLGFGLTVSNPIAIAFYLALLPGVIDLARATATTYLVLVAILTTVMIAIVAGYGIAAEVAGKLLADDPSKVRTERAAGAVLIAAGVWVAAQPFR